MKNYKCFFYLTRNIIILISLLIIFSCENFLDTIPTDTYNEVNWWKTEEQVISTLNGCYSILRSSGFYNFREDNLSPISYGMSTEVQLAQGTHNSGNYSDFKSRWEVNYRGIGRVNYLLDNVEKVELNKELLERIKGEAYFLRAYFYHILIEYYGGVPLILEAPKIEHGSLPRNTKEEVLKQIHNDLKYAINVLPISYSGKDKGRATKGAALALKTRIHLYESEWDEASKTATEIINLDTYDLFSDYRGLFLEENEMNEEVIFDIQYISPDYRHGANVALESQMGMAPTLYLVDNYLMIDGLPTDKSPMFNPDQPYENRDPRLHQTVVIQGYMFLGNIVPEGKYYSTGFGFKKYTTYKDDVVETPLQQSALNFILFRYADVLLMYAEAKNEVSGPDETIYNVLNKIRQRAGMPAIPENLSKEEMRELIRHERMIELAGESLHYNDIRRWKTAEIVMNIDAKNNKGEVVQKRQFNPQRDYLWPIHEIIKQDNPALEQNTGY